MPFPASNQNLADAYRLIKGRANDVRAQTLALNAASLAGPVSAERIISYCMMLARSKSEMATWAAVPGLTTYAQMQENNPSLDIVAEYTAMIGQIDATIAWISTNFPKDANGYLAAFTLGADGVPVYRSFDTASLAGFRAILNSLAATIS